MQINIGKEFFADGRTEVMFEIMLEYRPFVNCFPPQEQSHLPMVSIDVFPKLSL